MSKKIVVNEAYKGPPPILTAEEFEEALNQMTDDAIGVTEDFKGDREDAIEAGASYFLMNLPALTSRRRVQLYLAAVARGMQLGMLDQAVTKNCVYIAQLALAAFGTQNDGPDPAIRRSR